MSELLAGRRALVTGGATGIGRAVVERLVAEGAAVAVNYLDETSEVAELVREAEARGGTVVAVQGDVSVEDDVTTMFREARAAFGAPVDRLVSNAGIESASTLVETELADWQKTLDVNLTGPFLCARQFARDLIELEAPGVLVNITSVHEVVPWPTYAHYCASKGGLKLFTQTIARELAPHRIRAVNVAPGAIQTPINQELQDDPQKREEVLAQIPWGRLGAPEDVANAVVWALSGQADYLTGATLFIDGGMTLYPGITA